MLCVVVGFGYVALFGVEFAVWWLVVSRWVVCSDVECFAVLCGLLGVVTCELSCLLVYWC